MRVDNQIGLHAALGERHIGCGPKLRQNTLLTVTRRELITDNGLSGNAVLDTERLGRLVTSLGTHDADAFDVTFFGILVLHVVGDAVDVDVAVRARVEADIVPGGDLITFLDSGTNVRHSIFVDDVAHLVLDLVAGGESKQLGDIALGLVALGVVLGEGVDLGLVDGTVTEATFVSGLVDNHSVVHVVTGVRDNGHHGVHAVGEVVQAVGVVERRTNDGGLTGLDAVQLVVCTVCDGGTGSTHGLLAHLALVHVTRRLVVVGEGGHVGDDGEDVRRGELDVCGNTGHQVGLHTSNLHEGLLEGTNVVELVRRQVLDGTVHSR